MLPLPQPSSRTLCWCRRKTETAVSATVDYSDPIQDMRRERDNALSELHASKKYNQALRFEADGLRVERDTARRQLAATVEVIRLLIVGPP